MKKLVVILMMVALGSLAQASELWWTVSGADSYTWDTAYLCANQLGDNGMPTQNFGGTAIGSALAEDVTDGFSVGTELGDYANSSYSFYVELRNGSEVVAKSYVSMGGSLLSNQGSVKYSELSGNIQTDIMNPATAYDFSQFTTEDVVPEPTSGLLMALGLMMFALKRKAC